MVVSANAWVPGTLDDRAANTTSNAVKYLRNILIASFKKLLKKGLDEEASMKRPPLKHILLGKFALLTERGER
jgi:hypothetical protein